jgi:O-antigen/teichoic acid export membrane protein/glycosyltransferase involved in cell wall biosynthesis
MSGWFANCITKFLPKSSLARNTGWMLIGQGLGYGLRIIYFIVIARLLGVLQYGIVVGAYALVNLVAEHSRGGTGMVLLRYVSPNQRQFAAYWGNTLAVTAVMSGLLIASLRLLAPHVIGPASAAIIVATAVGSCCFEQIAISATQAFQAFQEMRVAAVLNQTTGALRTITAVGMLIVVHHATAGQWAIASAFASAVAAVIAVTTVTIRLGWPQFTPHLAWRHGGEGVEYAFASSTTSAYNDLDKAMLSHYGMSAANGIYGMAYRIIEMGSVPIAAIQLAAQPRLFQVAVSGQHEAVALGRRLLKHGMLAGAVAAVCMFASAPLIPSLAGPGFSESVSALRWLCLIPIFRSIHGITGSVLTAIGLQRYRTFTQITVVALNFLLNLRLIPLYGWHGAAYASLATDGALGLLNWSVLRWSAGHKRKSGQGRNLHQGHVANGVTTGPKPLVSIIIPYYNQPEFLAEAVSSAMRQTYAHLEVIVVDDGSTIPAESLLQQASGVVILRTDNRGVSAARNLGFQKSSGDYLTFLDADDRLSPGAIESHLQAFQVKPEAGLSFGSSKIIDRNGIEVRPARICRARKDYFRLLLENNPIGSPGATMMRREVFIAARYFNERFSMGEDYDLYLRVARQTPLVRHTSCVLEYREHNTNVSLDQERMLMETMAVLDQIEFMLDDTEKKRLRHARRRWEHVFRPRQSFAYRIRTLYFSLRGMGNMPLQSYLGK